MNSYNLLKIEDVINKAHPKQIINRVGEDIRFSFHEVKYEYMTNRNNKKVGTKYFLLKGFNPKPDYDKELIDYMKDYNESNKHRQISNVKFLDGQCLGYLNI